MFYDNNDNKKWTFIEKPDLNIIPNIFEILIGLNMVNIIGKRKEAENATIF